MRLSSDPAIQVAEMRVMRRAAERAKQAQNPQIGRMGAAAPASRVPG
jgi:hypothetical protein